LLKTDSRDHDLRIAAEPDGFGSRPGGPRSRTRFDDRCRSRLPIKKRAKARFLPFPCHQPVLDQYEGNAASCQILV